MDRFGKRWQLTARLSGIFEGGGNEKVFALLGQLLPNRAFSATSADILHRLLQDPANLSNVLTMIFSALKEVG